jgi:hypothetical protein
MSRLATWSAERDDWASHSAEEIVWLDRVLLSGGRDRSLHRSPRCPGLRYVNRGWEVFSRDTTHTVCVAKWTSLDCPDYQSVAATANFVLSKARNGLEAQPVRLDAGEWVIAVGKWVLPVRVDTTCDDVGSSTVRPGDDLPATYDGAASEPDLASSEAAARVATYFERNSMACLAMAYYYQDFIRGEIAPQVVPMFNVVVALDLSNEGAVSEYKKELQRRIWNEQGHPRELGKFLLAHGLIGSSALQSALKLAADNEAAGRTALVRERLRYRARRAT